MIFCERVCLCDSRGQDFRWQVGDVSRDLAASQELGHFISKRVAVVLQQVVLVTSGVMGVKGKRERDTS